MNHLQGKNIMLTRTAAQNTSTAALVKSLGANPVLFPCIRVEYLASSIQAGLKMLGQSEKSTTDIIFSSSNGVEAVAAQVKDLSETLAGFTVVAVGHKTAQALNTLGIEVRHIPNEASQQGLVSFYQQHGLPKQACFFRAEEGSDTLGDYFLSQGSGLTLIHCYRASCEDNTSAKTLTQLQQQHIDAVLLGSAKTARCYLEKVNNTELANQPVIVVMSTQVAQAADKLGLKVQVIAEEPGFEAMLKGLDQYFANKQGR